MRRPAVSEHALRRRLRALRRMLPAARAGDPVGVHQARVATRRLREAVGILDAGPGGRKLARRIKRLTRLLGPVRELDVAVQMLDELQAEPDAPLEAIAALRGVITRERAALQRDVQKRLDPDALRALSKRVVRLARAAGEREEAPIDGRRAWTQAGLRADRLLAAMEGAGSLYLPDRLHEVRIAAKKLRYACEIVGEVSGASVSSLTRQLKQTQDLLGRMHDLEVLILRTRGLQGSPLAASPGVEASLDQLVRRLETECRRLHARYVASRGRLITGCEGVTAAAARGRGDGVARTG